MPDILIEYLPSLRAQPFQFYSCFISYSHKDKEFAERIHADLQAKGVRCWFAPGSLKIGEKTRLRIDEAIRAYDKLLLILSKDSIQSGWVKYEVEKALVQERTRKQTVLFPIRLDDEIMKVEGIWADHIRDRHIGDFRRWKDRDRFQRAFDRLLRDLKGEAAKQPKSEEIRKKSHAVKLGGIWRGVRITEEDIQETRKELLERLEAKW